MEIVIIWLICGVIAAMIASQRQAGCLGFILGVLLGPFGIIAAFFIGGKQCLFCKSKIDTSATVCPKCQKQQ